MRIVKVLRVEDTRQWEEIEDDKWIPIPGSGIENQCARCNRSHEVHATVEVLGDDGQIGAVIVGTGCMHADETEFAKKITSVLNAQRTLEKNKRLLAKKEALKAEGKKIEDSVAALPVPAHEIREGKIAVGRFGGKFTELCIGDASVIVSPASLGGWGYTQERIECATWCWRQKRQDEHGMTNEMRNAWQWIKDLKKRVARAEKKIAEFGLQEERQHEEDSI